MGVLLQTVSLVTGPYQAVAFVAAALVFALRPTLRGKTARAGMVILALALTFLGASGLAASTYLRSKGLYHIRIVVLGTDGQPMDQASLTSSAGGELKQGNKNWEFDLPPQAKPSSGQVTFYAVMKDAYLSGKSTLDLKRDYYPNVTVQLSPLPQTTIRGTVVDSTGRSVAGAHVSVAGYPDISITDGMGNFSLPAHHADGQLVSVRAEKGARVAEKSAIAGEDIQLVLRSQ